MSRSDSNGKAVYCYACDRFSGKDSGWGKSSPPPGCGRCAIDKELGRYVSALYQRDCASFTPAHDLQAREQWAATQRARRAQRG